MRRTLVLVLPLAILAGLPFARGSDEPLVDGPEYTADGQLKFPADYREWVFLTSGLGMTYGSPMSQADDNPKFDNVFVNRPAYREFLATGHWPDKTIFVLEIRASQSKGSINNGGHFQTDAVAREVHVRDHRRFQGHWGFFGFGHQEGTAKQIPMGASCYSCHEQHGAVDTTFVQFYPTLLKVAKEKGTYSER
ncbi:MAG TPA: cytochrome P460 family protein [Bryobacteraceae bacterium]|nr:cytochrome P460 family protein [Bryobacteraceae bacterium]